ncbi:NUDIX hydrolase 6-like protein [Tanacetum coccineum]
MSESAKRHEENSNLIKEIRATTDAAIRNQGASIKTLEIQIGQISKVLQERGFGSLSSSTETNPRDQVNTLLYKSRQTTIPFPSRLDNHYCKEEEGNHGPKFMEAYEASHINNTIPQKEKDPGSFTLPCFINDVCFDNALVDLGSSVSVMPLSTYLNLGLGELAHTRLIVELADRTVKYPKGIAENVLVRIDFKLRPITKLIRPYFEGIITLYNGDDEVTYQMVRSHPRFKNHTTEQCNKIPPLLKVSEEDKKNRILHAYQKLKEFYKGVLNLGPDYIRDAKMEEWLIRGHISVHEME